MKKNIKILSLLSLVFVFGVILISIPKSADAHTGSTTKTGCTFGLTTDPISQLPCSLIVPCQSTEIMINHITGLSCPKVPVTTIATADQAPLTSFGLLKKGLKGEKIALFQEILNALGANLFIDGSFGTKTQQAVKSLQTRLGLGIDGVAGAKTLKALEDELKKTTKGIALLKKIKRTGGLTDKELEDFFDAARETVDMKDSSTWGVIVNSVPGTIDYRKDFKLRDGSIINLITHTHTP